MDVQQTAGRRWLGGVTAATLLATGLGMAPTASAAVTYELTEAYINNLTVSEVGSGTATWVDEGENGAVQLTTDSSADQAAVFLPVAPLGLTYATLEEITAIGYTIPSTTNEAANLAVEVADRAVGPYRTLLYIPAAGTTGEVDAGAGTWLDRSTGDSGLTWADLQARYPDSSVNKVYVSLGTDQAGSSSSVDKVTINGDDVYDFVFTGEAPSAGLGPEYKNRLTVQEENAGTATWESLLCTNGVVTLATTADEDQSVVNLPVLPLGLSFTMDQLTEIVAAVAANTGDQNLAINVQVAESASGPFITLQHVPVAGLTGEVDATASTWIDRSTLEENLSWSELQTTYAGFGVNRVWLSLGTFSGASSASVDYVTLNGQLYDFTVDGAGQPVPAPALPASLPGSFDGTLTVSPSEVAQGGAVTVTGSGFEPNSPVNLGMYDPKVDLGSATTDAAGALNTSVTIPAETAPGDFTIVGVAGACQADYSVADSAQSGAVSVTEVVVPPAPPCTGGGNCYLLKDSLSGGTADYAFVYGRPDDVVLTGDWDGDGSSTLTVRRGNVYYEKNTLGGGAADREYSFGRPDDVVLVGDWNGDGVDTLCVRRGKQYYFDFDGNGGEADLVIAYGLETDAVGAGDWDGDGVDTLSVRRGNLFYEKNTLEGGDADRVYSYGTPDDEGGAGDWDGDDKDTLAIRRGNQFYFDLDGNGGEADVVLAYGKPSDEVLSGDWNGDGADTLGVRR